MSYEYDIFISYSNENYDVFDSFIGKELYSVIEHEVRRALGKKNITIFIDKLGVKSGDDWENRIKNCLIKSRTMIAVISPLYFNSDWCKKEMSFMLAKEQDLQFRCKQQPSGLIFPLKIGKQEKRFPKYIQDKMTITDITGCAFDNIKEAKSVKYIELQEIIRNWAVDVADALDLRLNFKEEWMDADWQTQAHNKYSSQLIPGEIEYKKPTLEQRS